MQINKTNNINFNAKLVNTRTFEEAVSCAKNISDKNKKYSFFNAINIIHEDFGFKNFNINRIESAGKQTGENFKLSAENYKGDTFSYTTSAPEYEEDGLGAVNAIIDFILKFYGKRTAQYVNISRKVPYDELNSKIDGVIYRNNNRYVK